METNEREWTDRLADRPLALSPFTEELKMKIRERLDPKPKRSRRRLPRLAATLAGAAAVAGCLALLLLPLPLNGERAAPHAVRPAYEANGKVLLEAFPDPELKAGSPFGYLFRFTADMEELKGKRLAIEAVHLASGQRVAAVRPFVVTEPSSGYAGLERFTARFALPLPGAWRYEATLDGRFYADIVLHAGEPSWEPSPEFAAGGYNLTGVEGKVGILSPGFVAGQANKYMWSLWGADEELQGELVVKAVKRGETEMVTLFEGIRLSGANSALKIPSSLTLPEPGMWRLLPFVDGVLFDSIVVEAKQKPSP